MLWGMFDSLYNMLQYIYNKCFPGIGLNVVFACGVAVVIVKYLLSPYLMGASDSVAMSVRGQRIKNNKRKIGFDVD